MHDETKKTTFLDRAGDFILAHPYVSAMLIVAAEVLFLALLTKFPN